MRTNGATGCAGKSGPFRVSDLRQSRRREMMNGSKPRGPSGDCRRPSPKRRRPRLRVPCSPSPQPSPLGEGETFARALIIRPSLVVVCLRNERRRSGDCNCSIRIFQRRSIALPLPGGEGWGEGERSRLQPQTHDDSRNCQASRFSGSGTVGWGEATDPSSVAVFRALHIVLGYCGGWTSWLARTLAPPRWNCNTTESPGRAGGFPI